jgi:hypothetical protein
MGYCVVGERNSKWQPRKGLEGPFWFVNPVLYYDAREGKYYDPTTDFYVEQDEIDMLNAQLMRVLRG